MPDHSIVSFCPMRLSHLHWRAIVACFLLAQFITIVSPQQVYRNGPNGSLQPLNQAQTQNICGDCPAGTQREAASGPYCGRCVAPQQTCANGYYMRNGQCLPCSCPGTNGDRKFGTSCRVDVDGQVTCDCPAEYAGRDCSQCAPGAIQNNMPPYNCIRLNSTNSFSVTCPLGNRCPTPQIPQIVQPRPTCPYTNQQQQVGGGCPYTNQTTGLCPVGGCQSGCQQNGCNTPCQSGGCQGTTPCQAGCSGGPTPCQQTGPCNSPSPCQNGGCQGGNNGGGGCPGVGTGGGCPGVPIGPCPNPTNPSPQCPCPSPCGCPQNGCPGSCPGTGIQPPCGVQTPPPLIIDPVFPPWTTPAPPTCPGPITCPIQPPVVIQPPPCPGGNNGGCPGGSNGGGCPGGSNGGCQGGNNGGGGCPGGGGGSGGCGNPGGCPGGNNGGCSGGGGCPGTCPGTPGCGVTPACPSPCPNPCSTCPQIPACPNCELTCPPCDRCPPCGENGECVTCPNPCQPCPNPCQRCPDPAKCPDCNVTCPTCRPCDGRPPVGDELVLEPCICDPRGTVAQVGSQCICKVNVQGARCDQCKAGYFGISSSRPEGCLACFCSGLTDSCSLTPYYRSTIRTDRSPNCTIELTDDAHSVVYSQGSQGMAYEASGGVTFSKGANRRLFWSLPACFKGDRVTSYGGILSFTRMCSGSGNPLGADHEVMLVGGSGATVFWTTFETQTCDGRWNSIDVILAETAYWSSWKGEQYRRATRGDILEVLADLQLVLVRATFTSNTASTSIRNVSLSSVTHQETPEGVAMQVESCRCPTGYRGLSCENCAPGYYRDINDMSRSVFGACKPCPCGKTSEGCHLSGGQVICTCKTGFTGPLCQDKETITITCDPFRIREVEGANVDFTCSYVSNTKRRLLMRLGREGAPGRAEETTSITTTVKLEKDLRRVACEVVDSSGVTWAVVYCAIETVPQTIVTRPPPPRLIAMMPRESFICVNETDSVVMSCDMHNFGMRAINIEWRKEGNPRVMGKGSEMTIHNASPEDSGTYVCSASDGEVTGAAQVSLMVRRIHSAMRLQYPVNATGNLERAIHGKHGGDYPNYPYQMDGYPQADAPALNGTQGPAVEGPQISPVAPGHPKAVVSPVEITAKPGDTVVLRCNATGEEPLKFYWKSGVNDYIPVHVRVSHGALIFRTLRSQDAGVYYCVAWNHLGQSTARATILLDNSVAAQLKNATTEDGKPRVEVLHPEITARPGENVNFQCRSNQTGVTYNWTRVGEMMPNSSEHRRTDGLLTLYRVGERDKGTYLCTVTGPSGEKMEAQAVLILKASQAELLVPPRVTIKPKSPLRVRTGEKVRLECESSGSPLPNVTWVRSIDGTEKKLVSTSNSQAIYEIKQMSAGDVGKYTCNAVSTSGRKSESMSLVIDDGKACNSNEFRCKSGDQCIPRADRCDSEKDCKDGSDEENCKGSRRIRREIFSDEFST